jgi:hypothetical protein
MHINTGVRAMATLTKKPIQVYMRPEQLEALRALARKRDVPVAELVRQGIDRLLAEVPAEEDPLWDIVGMVDSPSAPTNLAEKHDEYLARWSREDHR